MSRIPIHIRPALESDAPALGALHALAFTNSAFLAHAFPGSTLASRTAYLHQRALQALADPNITTLVATAFSSSTDQYSDKDTNNVSEGEILALVRWMGLSGSVSGSGSEKETSTSSPNSNTNTKINPSPATAALLATPPPAVSSMPRNEAVITSFANAMKPGREKWVGEGDIVLDLLCTHPAHQGHGIGTTMLRWGMERADAAGRGIYLEASREGRGLYERLGWGVVGEVEVGFGDMDVDIDTTGRERERERERVCLMRREPVRL
ncbi:acyl-CoA N-acyltransferase [Aspergillus heteromorphus CBS 117.55]|uniref:Acyl-CoA N-acyltransferase n=1 Tax=Aspergillus heteromorphus CBS 117.55 TaxID=1448321 RepID=A0A317VSQ2_9EURO|nr:acyl-CoA N-acyltransferase [Aspergillus heteromorphus CBS 117.55]PWY77404.1 acyl-CoA N-acyltransferase [Aspergillus heteromorphus CBS 117.55]